MNPSLSDFLGQVRACRICEAHLPLGPKPIFQLYPSAKLLIIGQAPGTYAHQTGTPFKDASGDRLRQWLNMTSEDFYNPEKVAIVPMGLCYPGRLPKGGDKPPRPECAPQWHQALLARLPHCQLTLLIGRYAQAYYLRDKMKLTVADTVKCWQEYQPFYFPLPHPSWRTKAWSKHNPWFENTVLPALQARLKELWPGTDLL
jgi:uracil-DNA glycosylase